MKRAEFLINDIRLLANVGESRYSDELLTIYLNEAQKEIREIIFLANNESNILRDVFYIDILQGEREYDLPERMFAENSIISVGAKTEYTDRDEYRPLRYLNIKDYRREYGYSLFNKKFLLSVRPEQTDVESIQIYYNSQLPEIQKRAGFITNIVGNTLSLGTGYTENIPSMSDYVTVVDKFGSIIKTDVLVLGQNMGQLEVGDASGITTGSYVVVGPYSTTNSRLPIECEDYLKKYCERRISAGDSSADYSLTEIFSNEERQRIMQIFEKSGTDTLYPVISTDTPWI